MTLLPKGGLIVSCQARADNPLHGAAFMAAMARAAEAGGAMAIRANGEGDIRAIVAATGLPVIGINKVFSDAPVYITPDAASVRAVVEAGARIVALDCTDRARAGDPWRDLIALARGLGAEVMADIATRAEGRAAAAAGATYVATTLAGYTGEAVAQSGPDLSLVAALAAELSVPVIAEGRIATPEDAAAALDAGAHAVVVGTAITNPREITRRFVAGMSVRWSLA